MISISNAILQTMTPLISRRGATAVILTCIVLVTLDRAYYWFNHPFLTFADQAIYLDIARLLLEGQVPYVDFFEWNPPLIMYLSIVPVLISQVVPIHPALALNLSTVGLAFIASIAALRLADRYLDDKQFGMFIPILAGAMFFNFDQDFDTAEREHLFMISYIPFMLVRYINWTTGKRVTIKASIATGLLAGIAIALKPQFLAAFLIQEAVFYMQNRNWKRLFLPEMWAVAVVHFTYVIALCFLPKAAWEVLVTQVGPLFLHGYDYSRRCLMYMLHGGFYFANPTNLFALALVLAIVFNRYSNWMTPLTAFAFASFVNYVHGEQAWVYRMIPMASASVMIIFLTVGLFVQWLRDSTRRPAVVNCVALSVLLIATASYCWSDYHRYMADIFVQDSQVAPLGGYIGRTSGFRDLLKGPAVLIWKYTKPGAKVLYVGVGIADGYPAILQTNRRSATRYPFSVLILIEHCIRNRPDKEFWKNLMEIHLKNYENDIKRDKPELIMVFDQPAFVEVLNHYDFFKRCIGADYIQKSSKNSCLVFVRKNR